MYKVNFFNLKERKQMTDGVNTRIADLKTVIGRTTQHRQTLLQSAAATLRRNYIQIRKMKSVYYILNQFSLRDGQLVMIGIDIYILQICKIFHLDLKVGILP